MSKSADDAVGKALAILSLLAASDEAVRVSDVSADLGIAVSTAHRTLNQLRAKGFVDQDPGSRRYRLGPAVDELRRRANPHGYLVEVARRHREPRSRHPRHDGSTDASRPSGHENDGCRRHVRRPCRPFRPFVSWNDSTRLRTSSWRNMTWSAMPSMSAARRGSSWGPTSMATVAK